MYEVINKELGIKACGLADLTAQQMSNFLGQWEDGATIGTLTLFFEDETGAVVLNKDNKNYEFYVELAEGYLGASEENRRELREKCPESIRETMNVLERCLRVRVVSKEIFRAEQTSVPCDLSIKVLQEMYNRSNHPLAGMLNAFKYGVTQGKRLERAKKRQSVNA